MSDRLEFKPDDDDAAPSAPWRVLIADDEEEIHGVTALALSGFQFKGRSLQFLHAYSAAQAKEIMRTEPDIALLLLDVVMESDQAGLEVVEYVRGALENPFTRIVLRTGQPGQAPELEVITRYDINDYKHKTELTRQRLLTTICTSLSTYRDLKALERNRRGLSMIIDASARIFELHSLEYFAQGVLEQLSALLFLERDSVVLQASGLAARGGVGEMTILAGTGAFSAMVGKDGLKFLPEEILERLLEAKTPPKQHFGRNFFVGRQGGHGSGELVFYVGANRPLNRPDTELIQKFCANVSIAHRNLGKLAAARGRRTKDRER